MNDDRRSTNIAGSLWVIKATSAVCLCSGLLLGCSEAPPPAAQPASGTNPAVAVDPLSPEASASVTVPNVLRMHFEDATTSLQSAGLLFQTSNTSDSSQPDGYVLAQDPKAGDLAPSGSTVALQVNKLQSLDGTVNVCTIQQKKSGRFVDAHEVKGPDSALVTRPAQNNDTQRWVLTSLGNNTYTIQQKSNGRFVDAHEVKESDYALVTRPTQNNDTQRWVLTSLGNNTYTIQQKSSGRFVDAHEVKGRDFALVTRTAQSNDTQRWLIKCGV